MVASSAKISRPRPLGLGVGILWAASTKAATFSVTPRFASGATLSLSLRVSPTIYPPCVRLGSGREAASRESANLRGPEPGELVGKHDVLQAYVVPSLA